MARKTKKTKEEIIVDKILKLLIKEEDKIRRKTVFDTFKLFLLEEKNINLELIYQFSKKVSNKMSDLNFIDLEQAIINSGSPKYNFLYAKDVIGADITKHSKVVLDSKDPEYNFLFETQKLACDNVYLNKHLDVLISLNNVEYCAAYIRSVGINDKTIKKFKAVALATQSAELCYLVCDSGYIVDIEAFSGAAMKDDDGCYNYLFALRSDVLDKKGHGEAVIRSKSIESNYRFARDIPGADIKGHAQVIIDSKDKYMNYNFAKNIPGADIKAHYEATKHIISDELVQEYNYLFEQDKEIGDVKQLILSLNCEKPKRKKNGEI